MRLHEITNKKEQVDEWGIPAAAASMAGTAIRLAPHVLKYGKKAYDYGKKFLPVLKKAKAVTHGIGPKVHAAGEIGKKIVKKSPPTPGDGSELDKTAMVPGPQAYHKQVASPERVARPKSTKKFGSPVGPMSNLERKRQRT